MYTDEHQNILHSFYVHWYIMYTSVHHWQIAYTGD